MQYRPELDGLRAVAVVLVVLFHYGIAGFSGGYIGVDIFFVLSGYLIGSLILRQLSEEKFNFKDFYFRRLRRLFPAYILVIVVSFVAAYFLLLPREFREFGQSVVASAIYSSNILFYIESGYFDTSSHLKPLLHTWSLSVEEQFYIFYPLLAILISKLTNTRQLLIVAGVTLASLFAAALYIHQDQSAVFYLYPFRAWEMLTGTILAYFLNGRNFGIYYGKMFSWVGLALIVVPSIIYTSETTFPGMAALAPCLGAAFLIYGTLEPNSVIRLVLASTIPVFIGKISYSLYLWHWPVFVLYTYSFSGTLNNVQRIWMVIVTCALSYITWRFIENPIRQGKFSLAKSPRGVYWGAVISTLFCLSSGYYIYQADGMYSRLDKKTAEFVKAGDNLFGGTDECVRMGNPKIPQLEFCELGSPLESDEFIVVWGDSHAAAYKYVLNELSVLNNVPVLIIWQGGCPPLVGVGKSESMTSKFEDDKCLTQNQNIVDFFELRKEKIVSTVFIGRWSYYFHGEGVGESKNDKITLVKGDMDQQSINKGDLTQSSIFLEEMEATILWLADLGINPFILQQVPEFPDYSARDLAIGLIRGDPESLELAESLSTISYDKVYQRQGEVNQLLADLNDLGVSKTLNTHGVFCLEGKCSAGYRNSPVFFDDNHLSSRGSVALKAALEPVF